jgi:hypothetical protein
MGKLKMERQGKLKMKRHLMSPLMIFVWAIVDAHREAESVNEKWKLKGMLEDHKKSCTQIAKMATQSSIPHQSCSNGRQRLIYLTGLSDKGFEKLLKIIKKKLPKDNELPDSTYKAKKVLYPLGLEVQKIHACINDCILYCGEEYEIWKHARYALHCGIRSDEMTLVMLRASPHDERTLVHSKILLKPISLIAFEESDCTHKCYPRA